MLSQKMLPDCSNKNCLVFNFAYVISCVMYSFNDSPLETIFLYNDHGVIDAKRGKDASLVPGKKNYLQGLNMLCQK